MAKEPTKAELLAQIASMQDERREGPEASLIRAIAGVVAGSYALNIKHLLYRVDADGMRQITIDMHEDQT